MIEAVPTSRVKRLQEQGWWRRQVKVHAYIFETVLLLTVLVVVNLGVFPGDAGFVATEPNPLWIVILLMVGRYGFRAGMLSSILSAAAYCALVGYQLDDPSDLVLWRYAKSPVLFIVAGVVFGMLVQRFVSRISKLEEESLRLHEENRELRSGEGKLREVNEELANRVVNATHTLPTLYKYAKRLNALKLEELYTALTEMVMDVLKAEQVSVYVLDRQSNRLMLHSRNGEPNQDGELRLDPAVFEMIFDQRQPVSLHDLLARNIRRKDLLLCGPLGAKGAQVDAVLAVEALAFLRYSPATIRLFGVVIEWAAECLAQSMSLAAKPDELRREENKRAVQRAQGVTWAPAATGLHPAVINSSTIIVDGATPVEVRHPEQGAPLGAAITGAGAGGELSKLLSNAADSLFGDAPAAPVADVGPGELAGPIAAIGSVPYQREELRTMLNNELEIAGENKGALSKLLGEIDDYLSGGRGGRA